MKEKDLQKKREKYELLQKEREQKIQYKNELVLAAKNKNADRIIELLNYVEIDYIAPTDEELCRKVFRPVLYQACDQDSKQIMFYMGNYRRENESSFRFLGTSFDGVTHKEYMDLETGKVYQIEIGQSIAFEKNHIIIGKEINDFDYSDYNQAYSQFQLWYFLQLTLYSQDQMMVKLRRMDEEKVKQIIKK